MFAWEFKVEGVDIFKRGEKYRVSSIAVTEVRDDFLSPMEFRRAN